jgi:two-component system, chemotaxis family, chemotaxis protein CheY
LGESIIVAIRALLVEDSIPIRALLRRRLEQLGCDVVGEAATAEEGLALFRDLLPDLITLDLLMPDSGTDAKELFRAIRKESPAAVVIVISGRPKSIEAAAFLREGALAYLEKPFISLSSLTKPLARVFPDLKPSPLNRLRTGLDDSNGRL